MKSYHNYFSQYVSGLFVLIFSLLASPAVLGKRPIEAVDTMRDTGVGGDGSLWVFLGLFAAVMALFYLKFPKDGNWMWGIWVAPLIAALLTRLFL